MIIRHQSDYNNKFEKYGLKKLYYAKFAEHDMKDYSACRAWILTHEESQQFE